jgi:hypothetical protein
VIAAGVWLVAIVLLVVAARRMRRTRGRLGTGAGGAGAVYDMLNEDKRRAIEIIVEEKAEARDPEDKDGDLPQLEDPRRRR